jgi:hypothetical protein
VADYTSTRRPRRQSGSQEVLAVGLRGGAGGLLRVDDEEVDDDRWCRGRGRGGTHQRRRRDRQRIDGVGGGGGVEEEAFDRLGRGAAWRRFLRGELRLCVC